MLAPSNSGSVVKGTNRRVKYSWPGHFEGSKKRHEHHLDPAWPNRDWWKTEKKYTKENNLCELTIKLRVQTGAYNMEIIFFRKGNSQSTSKFSFVNNQKRPALFTFTLIVATYLRTLFCKGHSITITHVRLPWAIGKSHAINYVRVLYFSKVLGHIS